MCRKTDRIIREPELLKRIGVSSTTLWRWEKNGLFPKRIPLGPNCKGWLESEINEWFDKKVRERSPKT